MKSALAIAAERATGERVIRQYCGNDGGLFSPKSSPFLFWLAAQLMGEQRCPR